MSRRYCTGTEAGEPGAGLRGAGGKSSPAGMTGVPWGPVGARHCTSEGCKTTTCFSVNEVLRFPPQQLTRRGECGLGRPRGMTMKRKWGVRMSLAVSTFPLPGQSRCLGLLPPSCGLSVVVGGWVVPPSGCLCPAPWVQTPVGGGYKAPGCPPPLHNSLPGAVRPLTLAGVGSRTACRKQQGQRGLEPHVRAAPP